MVCWRVWEGRGVFSFFFLWCGRRHGRGRKGGSEGGFARCSPRPRLVVADELTCYLVTCPLLCWRKGKNLIPQLGIVWGWGGVVLVVGHKTLYLVGHWGTHVSGCCCTGRQVWHRYAIIVVLYVLVLPCRDR